MWKAFLAVHAPRALLIASILSALAVSLPAQAEDEPSASETLHPPRAQSDRALIPYVRLDVHGVLTWEAELGTGLRADILVFDETRHYDGRDELALSAGLDLSFVTFAGQDRVTVWPTLTVQWSLSVSEHFVLYPELGIVAQIRPGDFRGLFPNVGVGGRINVYKTLEVLVRVGWPMAVTVGIAF